MLEFLPVGSVADGVMEPAARFAESIPAKNRPAGSTPAVPRLVFRRTDDALVQPERWTRARRTAVLLHDIETVFRPLVRAGKIRTAIMELALQVAAESVARRDVTDRLEDRIAALESTRRI